MAKKDFGQMKTTSVYGTVAQATGNTSARSSAGKEEQAARAAALQTQGRKGCKAIRINMAFTPENHEFIKVMAKASGRTMTEFTNLVIAAYQREHPEIMEQARGFLNTINFGAFSSLLGDDE